MTIDPTYLKARVADRRYRKKQVVMNQPKADAGLPV